MQISTLAETIEKSIRVLESKLPNPTVDNLDQLQELHDKFKSLNSTPKHIEQIQDGVTELKPNPVYFTTLREALTAYRDIVLPAIIRVEMSKLRSVAAMADAAEQSNSPSEQTKCPTQ